MIYTEDTLIEQPAIALFQELGWEHLNCFHERFGPGGTLGRETPAEVVLLYREKQLTFPTIVGNIEVNSP